MLSLLAVTLAVAPPALHQATSALDDLKYEEALAQLPPEASVQGYSRAELVEWFSTRALAQLGLKKEAEATQTFLKLFAFAPDWQLPDQYGPRVRTVVAAARAEAARGGVVSLGFDAGRLVTTKDSRGFATSLEVSWREPGGAVQRATLAPEPQQAPPWPRDRKLEVWGRVLGLGGSTLFEWGNEHAPLRLEPLAVVSVETPLAPAPPSLGRWSLVGLGLGGAALVAGGLGVGFAVASQDAEHALAGVTRDGLGRITSLTQRDAFALDARVKSNAELATVFTVSAVALAAVGAGLVLVDRLTLTPGPAGVTARLELDLGQALAEAHR